MFHAKPGIEHVSIYTINNHPLSRNYLPRRIDDNVHRKVQECKNAFLSVFQVGNRIVEGVCKRYFHTGNSPKENRGGDVRIRQYANKRESVKYSI